MTREISPDKRVEVLKLYFEGFAYDEIARRTGAAKGSVAAIVQEMRDGRFPQFELGTHLVSELRDLTVGLRKVGIAASEASLFFALVKKFIGLGVEPAHLESWVRMCRAIPEGGFPRSRIIVAAVKLAELEQEGSGYEQTLERLASSSAELKRLQEKMTKQSAEETELQRRKDELLQVNHSLEAESVRLQKELDSMTAKTKQAESRCHDLEERSRQYRRMIDQLEARKGELTGKVSQLEERVLALSNEVTNKAETLQELDGLGFSQSDLGKLKGRLSDIAQRHGKEEVDGRFFGYLETYDALLSMEATQQQLTQEIESLAEERESLSKLGKKLGLTSDHIAEGIAVMKSLQAKGASPLTILSYQRTLTAAGLAPGSFEKLVKDLGGIERTLAARRTELDRMVRELEEKRQALEELKGEVGKVKESITALRDAGTKQIESMMSSATSEVERLHQELSKDIGRWGQMRAEMGKFEEELRLARYFAKLPLSDDALSKLVEDLAAPVIIEYLSIALAWCREKLNPKLRPPRVITERYYSIREYTEVELADVLNWALLMLIEGINSGKE